MKIDIQKINELEAWYALFNDPEFLAGTPEDYYDARLALADDLVARGVIDKWEWKELMEAADAGYSEELG